MHRDTNSLVVVVVVDSVTNKHIIFIYLWWLGGVKCVTLGLCVTD